MGRGAQKGLAKLASHLEPFATVDIEIIKGRRSTTVIAVDRQKSFLHIASSFERRLLAAAILHMLERYTRDEDEDPELYAELLEWMEFLDRDEELKTTRSTFLLGAFILRLMQRLGYETQLSHCVNCKEAIVPLSFRWHAGKGGLVCSDCVRRDGEEWITARPMDVDTVKLLRFAREASLEELLAPALSGRAIEAFALVVHDLEAFHLPGDYDTPFWCGVMADYVI
jgi:DNA repair protein RecO (recombination protein O)